MYEKELYVLFTDNFSYGIVIDKITRRCIFTAPAIYYLQEYTIGDIKEYCKSKSIKIKRL